MIRVGSNVRINKVGNGYCKELFVGKIGTVYGVEDYGTLLVVIIGPILLPGSDDINNGFAVVACYVSKDNVTELL